MGIIIGKNNIFNAGISITGGDINIAGTGGNIIVGATAANAAPQYIRIANWSTVSTGSAQFIAGWQGTQYWGLGTDAATGDLNVKLGNTSNSGTWQSTKINLVVTGNITCTALTQTSDQNLKTNITPYADGALAKVNAVKVNQYQYIADLEELGTAAPIYTGLIAQEAPPETVTSSATEIVLYSMASVLWKAVQELSAELDAVKTKIGM